MSNKLKNYSTQPDPEVWNKIKKTLRREEFRRQAIGGTIGTIIAVAAIVTVVLWPYDTKPTATESVMPQVAQMTETPAQASPATEQITAEAAQAQAQQQPAMTLATPKSTKVETMDQQSQASVEVAPAVPTVSQQKSVTVIESKPVVESRPAVVARPTTKVEPAAPKVETQPATEVENDVVESKASTSSVKNTINNGVIEDTILWVPNAFAPASDNPDITTFRARLNKTDASILNYRINVFNRQGHQVFHSTDINQAWDGTYKGRALPQGGYVYVIYYVDKDGLTHQRKGTVALIR